MHSDWQRCSYDRSLRGSSLSVCLRYCSVVAISLPADHLTHHAVVLYGYLRYSKALFHSRYTAGPVPTASYTPHPLSLA